MGNRISEIEGDCGIIADSFAYQTDSGVVLLRSDDPEDIAIRLRLIKSEIVHLLRWECYIDNYNEFVATEDDRSHLRIEVSPNGSDLEVAWFKDDVSLDTHTIIGGDDTNYAGLWLRTTIVTFGECQCDNYDTTIIKSGQTFQYSWDNESELDDFTWEPTPSFATGRIFLFRDEQGETISNSSWPIRPIVQDGLDMYTDEHGIMWDAITDGSDVIVRYRTSPHSTWSSAIEVATAGSYDGVGITGYGGELVVQANNGSTVYQWHSLNGGDDWTSDGAI